MDKNINKPEVKKGRFNIVDALIVIIVLILIFSALWIFDPFNWFSANEVQDVNLRYVVELKGIDDDVKNNIKIGENVSLSSTNYVVGKVISLKTQESVAWEYDADKGAMVKKTIEGKNDIYVTIELNCTYENGVGYMINGQQIAVGTSMNFRFANFASVGTCVSMEVVQ